MNDIKNSNLTFLTKNDTWAHVYPNTLPDLECWSEEWSKRCSNLQHLSHANPLEGSSHIQKNPQGLSPKGLIFGMCLSESTFFDAPCEADLIDVVVPPVDVAILPGNPYESQQLEE